MKNLILVLSILGAGSVSHGGDLAFLQKILKNKAIVNVSKKLATEGYQHLDSAVKVSQQRCPGCFVYELTFNGLSYTNQSLPPVRVMVSTRTILNTTSKNNLLVQVEEIR